jgi:hypothetical protein
MSSRPVSSQKKIQELEGHIKVAQIKVLEQKQKMGGVNASKENDAMIAKQIRTLENRLDKALIKFNESLAQVGGLTGRKCRMCIRIAKGKSTSSEQGPPREDRPPARGPCGV